MELPVSQLETGEFWKPPESNQTLRLQLILGRLWVTRKGDLRDYLLTGPVEYRITPGAGLLAEALSPAEILVLPDSDMPENRTTIRLSLILPSRKSKLQPAHNILHRLKAFIIKIFKGLQLSEANRRPNVAGQTTQQQNIPAETPDRVGRGLNSAQL